MSAPSVEPRDVHALRYRNCGHIIMATGDRDVRDRTAYAVTGLGVRIATDADLAALMTPRRRRCRCRIKDGFLLAAWQRAVTAEGTR